MTARLVYKCDDCGEELDAGTDRYDEAKETFREERWSARKEGPAWLHYCPDCKPAARAGYWSE